MTVPRPSLRRGLPRSPGRAALLAATAVATAAGLAPAAAGAAVPEVESRLAAILSPRADAAVRGGAVSVRVRLRPAVVSFSAALDGAAVTRRFARARDGRLRVASLPTRGLRGGEHRLVVRTRARGGAIDVDHVRFAVLRRHAPLLRVAAARRDAGATVVRLRVLHPDTVLSARLNGRAIPAPNDGRRVRRLVLAADEGLRFGRNGLRVRAVDRARGRHDVERRAIRIGRDAPIPGAGRDRTALARRPVTLDAGRSRAARVPGALRYRWRFVRTPRGSRARLLRAASRTPRFTPDRPGRYRLRLTVAERMPAPARRGSEGPERAGAAAPAASAAAAGPLVSASDTVATTVVPRTPAVGLPLDTLAAQGATIGVQIGDAFHAAPDQSRPLQLVVLDRATLELRANASYGNDDASTASLEAAVAALDDSALVIVSTPRLGTVVPVADAAALANVNGALRAIGATPLAATSRPAGAHGPTACTARVEDVCAGFSAIGIPGLPGGQGTINPGMAVGSAAAPATAGALRGLLQRDMHGNFAFVSPEYVPFDTTAAGTGPGQAAIQVGETVYRSDVLPDPDAGVFVLVLDAGSLHHEASETFRLRYGDLDGIVHDMQQLSGLLDGYASDASALVFVQSIGRLARWDAYEGRTDLSAWWNRVGASLQRLGGHAMLFDALTDDGYVQVGPAMSGAQWGYPAPYTKLAGPKAGGTPPELAGTLARNASSQFHPQNAAAVPDLDDDLPLVAYQPPTPWPLRDQPAARAAISCVADALELPMPIEVNYASGTLDWGTRAATMTGLDLDDLDADGRCDPSAFAAADLAAVKRQLHREFTAVQDVRNWIGRVKEPFEGSASISPLKVAAISDAIQASVRAPASEPVESNGMDIAEDAFLILGAVPGLEEFTLGTPDMIASLIGLVGDTTTTPDGAQELEYDATTADELGIQIDEGYEDAKDQFDHVFAILVGDWGKLQAAEQRQSTDGAWEWDDERSRQAVDLLGAAAQRQAYDQLFPTVYDELLLGKRGNGADDVPDDARQFTCRTYKQRSRGTTTFTPFGGASEHGWVTPATAAGPVRENLVFAAGVDPGTQDDDMVRGWLWRAQFPSDALTRGMFATNMANLDTPPLQPLPFALSIWGRTTQTTLSWMSTQDADGGIERNVCRAG